jgi:hypothetical protein
MYGIELINSTDEADLLLRMARREKRTLNVRRESLALRNENASDNEAERNADILAAQSELDALTSLINSLPDGARKEAEITKKLSVELRLRRLTIGGSDENPVTVVERNFDTSQMDREMAGIDEFITAVEERRGVIV